MTRTVSIASHYSMNQFIDGEMDPHIILGPFLSTSVAGGDSMDVPAKCMFSVASFLASIALQGSEASPSYCNFSFL